MTTLLPAGRKRILRELDVGMYISNSYITALGASSFTSPNFFLDPVMSPSWLQDRNAGIVRGGAASAADFWRPAGGITISSGVVAQPGSVWSDTTLGSEDIEIWYHRVRPDQEVLDSLNRVLIKEFVTTYLAVSHLSRLDGDMALSTDTNWTDVGTPTTSAKSTVAAATPWGMRSYRLVGDATNEGTQSAPVLVRQAGNVTGHALITADIGTASLQFRDVTNSADIGTAVTHSERRTQLMSITNQQVPATAKSVALRALGTTNPSDFYINQMWLYNMDNPVCPLPALISDSFQAPKILQAVPMSTTANNVYDAESFDFRPLQEGIDYWLVINPSDAAPYKVRFRDTSLYQWPLFVEARVPQASLVTMAAESDAFWDLNKVIPRWKKDLLETVYNTGARRHPDWQVQYNLAKEQLTEASKARPKKSIASEKPYWSPRLSA